MLHVHFSNRYEVLSRLLLEQLAGPRDNVFASEQVIVPSTAVRRALTLQIADREGVCANVEFVYLAKWLWRQVARVVDGVKEESPFDPAALAWRVYAAFGDQHFVSAHPRLAAYLQRAGADLVMRYELAMKTAGLLEQYVTYRTDWLAKWQGEQPAPTPTLPQRGRGEQPAPTPALPRRGRGKDADRGGDSSSLPLAGGADDFLPPPPGEGGGGGSAREDEAWQAALWQRIAGELQLQSAHPLTLLIEALERGGERLARERGLPTRVHVFALAAVPPLHLQALQALGRWIDVQMYVLNPCQEYWFEVVDRKRLSYLAARDKADGHETGNRLLAAWGAQTQSHIGLLIDTCGDAAQDDAAFVPSDNDTLLAHVQNAILDLRELEPGSIELAPTDRSIEIRLCHSLTRELEVLHDHLLGLFAPGDGLRPSDVLVVTPDLEAAAPLIEAVFGTVPAERRIPFAITGRARSTVNAPVRALLDLLTLASSRCPASAVYGLLQQTLVARRFGLDDDALQQVHDWMLAAGIHWGLDAEHVDSLDLPDSGRHSFADGLDRLFLGYAMPTGVGEPLKDILPSGDAEGSAAVALGAFWRYVEALQTLRRQFAQPRTPEQWGATLGRAIDSFMDARRDELDDLSELNAAIAQLTQAMSAGGLAAPVPLGVVRQALQNVVDDPARGGVPGGSVTFASISSLRNLPYAVVCAIGLNDGAFPTVDRPAEFDLMARDPRRGDRQRRADQRNLFLDLLLAARRSFYLSYTGRSVRDNSSLPPSVLVSELLDVLVPAIAADPADPDSLKQARARLLVAHPLQPFSPTAFAVDGDQRLRSFDRELAEALRRSLQAPAQSPEDALAAAQNAQAEDEDEDPVLEPTRPFFTGDLGEPEEQWRDVSVPELVSFFRNPSRYLLSKRMGITLAWREDTLADDEPFVPDYPGRAALAQRLLPILLSEQQVDPDALTRLAAAGVELPPGAIGQVALERELGSLMRFAQQVREASAEPVLPPHQASIELDIDGQPWRVQAGLADLRPSGLARWRYDEERPGDVLEAWIHHLVLCADPPPGTAPVTQWLSSGATRRLQPRADAREQLAALLRLYWRGLRQPLPFFPKAAWKFASSGKQADARNAWLVTARKPFAEGSDPAYQLAFRGMVDPLAETDFYDVAMAVFAPVLQDEGAPE